MRNGKKYVIVHKVSYLVRSFEWKHGHTDTGVLWHHCFEVVAKSAYTMLSICWKLNNTHAGRTRKMWLLKTNFKKQKYFTSHIFKAKKEGWTNERTNDEQTNPHQKKHESDNNTTKTRNNTSLWPGIPWNYLSKRTNNVCCHIIHTQQPYDANTVRSQWDRNNDHCRWMPWDGLSVSLLWWVLKQLLRSRGIPMGS